MRLLRLVGARLRGLIFHQHIEREMEEELRFHVRRLAEENVRRGMTRTQAERAALRRFGSLTRIKESCRDIKGGGWMETLLQDLRYGARTLLKNRGVSFVILLTLALGVGANAAIFGVVEGVILRPLPFGDAERIVGLRESLPEEPAIPVAYRTYAEWREGCGAVFEGVAAVSAWDFNLDGAGEAERVAGARATSNYFDVMGVRALKGRGFLSGDERADAPRVAVVDEGLANRRFGNAGAAVGQTIRLDDTDYEIVGVMPTIAERTLTGWSSVWTPFVVRSEERARANPFRYLTVNARLREGATLEQARAETERVMTSLRQAYPDTHGKPYGVVARRLEEFVVTPRTRTALFALAVVVAFVLLIACANVANLLLARAATREREIAVRTALGASRGRVVRQLLTESLLVALAGSLAGLALAHAGLKALVAVAPDSVPRLADVRIAPVVFGFALALTVASAIVFGLAPALVASKVDLSSSLKEAARGAGSSPRSRRLRDALVVVEVALALTLLVASGLMLRSYLHLRERRAGFDTENILTAELTLPARGYDTRERRAGFFREAIERVRNLPGVEKVAAAQSLPLRGPTFTDPLIVEGRPEPPRGQVPFVRENIVTPDYFRAMGMQMLEGRAFTEQETWETGGAIVVNEAFARKFFAGEDAVGKRIRLGAEKPWMTVVGVIGDTLDDGFDGQSIEQMFYPYTNPSDELPLTFLTLVVRTSVEPESAASSVRGVVRQIDPNVPVSRVQTMRALAARATSGARFQMLLTALFAALALVLAGVGLYGVMSYAVAQRTHEIGVRLALGARRADVLRLVVGQGMKLALTGVAAGLLCAFTLMRLIAGLLFGVSASDPVTFVGVAILLASVALLACLVPAWRATRVDPLAALRHE